MTYPPPPPPPPPPGPGPYEPPPGYGQQPYGYGPPGQQPYGYGPQGPPPDNYLVWSILSTLLCCLPLGIVAIINSSKVNGLWAAGQFAEAQKASQDAKKFAMWSALAIVIIAVIYVVIVAVAALISSV